MQTAPILPSPPGIPVAAGGAVSHPHVASHRVSLLILLALVALVPLLVGIFDVCVFAPLFRAPFKGKEVRDRSDRIAS